MSERDRRRGKFVPRCGATQILIDSFVLGECARLIRRPKRKSAAGTNALVTHSAVAHTRELVTHSPDSLETRSAPTRRLLTFSVSVFIRQRYAVRRRLLRLGSRPPGVAAKTGKLGCDALEVRRRCPTFGLAEPISVDHFQPFNVSFLIFGLFFCFQLSEEAHFVLSRRRHVFGLVSRRRPNGRMQRGAGTYEPVRVPTLAAPMAARLEPGQQQRVVDVRQRGAQRRGHRQRCNESTQPEPLTHRVTLHVRRGHRYGLQRRNTTETSSEYTNQIWIVLFVLGSLNDIQAIYNRIRYTTFGFGRFFFAFI